MLIKCLNTVLYRVFQGWLLKSHFPIFNNSRINKYPWITLDFPELFAPYIRVIGFSGILCREPKDLKFSSEYDNNINA